MDRCPVMARKNHDGSLTYGTCWGCGTVGYLMRVLGDNLLCYDCWRNIKRRDPVAIGDNIARCLRELKVLER